MPNNQVLVIRSIQSQVRVRAVANTNSDTTGLPTDLTPLTGGDAANSASNLLDLIIESFYLRLRIAGKTYEEGYLEDFPPRSIVTGFAGATDEGIAQNGNGRENVLPVKRVVGAGLGYGVQLENTLIFTPTQGFRITTKLDALIFTL